MNRKQYFLAVTFVVIILLVFLLPELVPDSFDNLILLYAQRDDVLIDSSQRGEALHSIKYLFKLDIFLELFSKIAGAVSLLGLLYQFSRERSVNQAEFILNINNNFITNTDLMRVYKMLESSKSEGLQANPFTDDDIVDMANYLSFFEPFYGLIEHKVIHISALDQLAYRFFLAVNNRYMQEMLLCRHGKDIAWKDLFKLHDLWKRYRMKKDAYIIWQDDSDLSKYANYAHVVNS